jgi:hypothetical protein
MPDAAAAPPVIATVCETDPVTAACRAPTFSVFVKAVAPIAFDPANARIFLRFLDAGGTPHGSTSVAMRTQ